MAEEKVRHIATGFTNIHNIISRGIRVSLEGVREVIEHRGPEHGPQGLYDYVHALTAVLHAHHVTEDEVAFPYFRDRLPGAPFEVLTRWHEEMAGLVDGIKTALGKCEDDPRLADNWRELEAALLALDESWQPHIKMEMDQFVVQADALVAEEEGLCLSLDLATHSLEAARPRELTVPFMLYNLPPEDRSTFAQALPVALVEQLVQVIWKPRWEAMKPYLLE